jgi:hypothetical protein
MSSWKVGRNVRLEHTSSSAVDSITAIYPRFNEMWMGIEWRLTREGDRLGISRDENGLQYRLHVFEPLIDGLPEVVVLYAIEPSDISVIGVGANIGSEGAVITQIHQDKIKTEA